MKNSSGKFVAPNLVSAAAAAEGATVNPDLTYDPINASGAAAYPITSPTWIIVYQTQTDANKGTALKGFLNYIYNQGQKLAGLGGLRAAAQGAAQAGQGAGQEDHRPVLVISGEVARDGNPPPVPCPRPYVLHLA